MGDVRRRVGDLERAAGVSGSPWCECEGGKVTVLWDTGERVQPFCGPWPEVAPEPEPATCRRCGKPVRVVTLVWDDSPMQEDEAYGWKKED